MKKNVILVDRRGYFKKLQLDESELNETKYIGNTINGVPKYKWNFKMWFNTLFN